MCSLLRQDFDLSASSFPLESATEGGRGVVRVGSSFHCERGAVAPLVERSSRRVRGALRKSDLKEAGSTEERIGATAWSLALDQSSQQGLEDGVIFSVMYGWRWTFQRLQYHKLFMAGDQHLQ